MKAFTKCFDLRGIKRVDIMIACGECGYSTRDFQNPDGPIVALGCKRWPSFWDEVTDKDYCSKGAAKEEEYK